MNKQELKQAVRERTRELSKRHGRMNCYLFATIMVSEFGGDILYNHDHCIVRTQYNEFVYDQDGIFEDINKEYDAEQRSKLIDAIGKGGKLEP